LQKLGLLDSFAVLYLFWSDIKFHIHMLVRNGIPRWPPRLIRFLEFKKHLLGFKGSFREGKRRSFDQVSKWEMMNGFDSKLFETPAP